MVGGVRPVTASRRGDSTCSCTALLTSLLLYSFNMLLPAPTIAPFACYSVGTFKCVALKGAVLGLMIYG